MDSGTTHRTVRVPTAYRIVIRGEVTESFLGDFDGVVIESAGAESILRVEAVDQAKLYGILGWLNSHGIELLSVRPAAPEQPPG